LHFTLYGTPDGRANLSIKGVKGKILLPEVNKGEYSGSYTIRNRDKIASRSAVTANLAIGESFTRVTLGKAMHSASAPRRVAHACNNCGSVEAVNLVEVKGEGGYLGTVGGGAVGALLASHAIAGNAGKSQHYEVLVHLQNGATQMVSYAAKPGFRVGDQVRIKDGIIERNT